MTNETLSARGLLSQSVSQWLRVVCAIGQSVDGCSRSARSAR